MRGVRDTSMRSVPEMCFATQYLRRFFPSSVDASEGFVFSGTPLFVHRCVIAWESVVATGSCVGRVEEITGPLSVTTSSCAFPLSYFNHELSSKAPGVHPRIRARDLLLAKASTSGSTMEGKGQKAISTITRCGSGNISSRSNPQMQHLRLRQEIPSRTLPWLADFCVFHLSREDRATSQKRSCSRPRLGSRSIHDTVASESVEPRASLQIHRFGSDGSIGPYTHLLHSPRRYSPSCPGSCSASSAAFTAVFSEPFCQAEHQNPPLCAFRWGQKPRMESAAVSSGWCVLLRRFSARFLRGPHRFPDRFPRRSPFTRFVRRWRSSHLVRFVHFTVFHSARARFERSHRDSVAFR